MLGLFFHFEDVCVLDFLSWAIHYFITAQQKFRKELPGKKERKRKEKLAVRDLLHIKGFTDNLDFSGMEFSDATFTDESIRQCELDSVDTN